MQQRVDFPKVMWSAPATCNTCYHCVAVCWQPLQVMAVNVRGVFLCMKYEIPLLLETGNEGSIVITSSTAGQWRPASGSTC